MAQPDMKKTSHIPLDMSDHNKKTRWALRVLSIIFALVLWVFVSWDGSSLGVREIRIPLKYADLPDGYSVSSPINEVNVVLQGPLDSLLFSGSSLTASVGMQDLKPGKYRLPVEIASPEGVRVVRYSPTSVEFELFRIIERRMKPRLVLQGDLPGSFTLGDSKIVPDEVLVRGPEGIVLSIRQAEVRSTFENLRAGVERDLPVFLAGEDNDIAGLTVEPRVARVSAVFTEAFEERAVPVRAVMSGEPDGVLEVASVVVSPDTVRIRGPRSQLQNLNEIRLDSIDMTGIDADMEVAVPLRAPANGVEIIGPPYASVRIEFRSAVERYTFINLPVTVYGKGLYKDWSLSPESASATIEWSAVPGMTLDRTKPPFELYVDVTNVVSQQLTLPLLVKDLPLGITIIRLEPEQIEVKAVTP